MTRQVTVLAFFLIIIIVTFSWLSSILELTATFFVGNALLWCSNLILWHQSNVCIRLSLRDTLCRRPKVPSVERVITDYIKGLNHKNLAYNIDTHIYEPSFIMAISDQFLDWRVDWTPLGSTPGRDGGLARRQDMEIRFLPADLATSIASTALFSRLKSVRELRTSNRWSFLFYYTRLVTINAQSKNATIKRIFSNLSYFFSGNAC